VTGFVPNDNVQRRLTDQPTLGLAAGFDSTSSSLPASSPSSSSSKLSSPEAAVTSAAAVPLLPLLLLPVVAAPAGQRRCMHQQSCVSTSARFFMVLQHRNAAVASAAGLAETALAVLSVEQAAKQGISGMPLPGGDACHTGSTCGRGGGGHCRVGALVLTGRRGHDAAQCSHLQLHVCCQWCCISVRQLECRCAAEGAVQTSADAAVVTYQGVATVLCSPK
jgi:hypothetical protein